MGSWEVDPAGYQAISFSDLSSFDYVPSNRSGTLRPRIDPFPAEVRALDGKRVSISGFMNPMYVQDGKVREFYLSAGGVSCCFADAPRPTQIVKVMLPSERSTLPVAAARVWGLLEMKEEFDEEGSPMPLYRMRGEMVRADEGEETSLARVAMNAGVMTLVVAAGFGFVLHALIPWYKECRIGLQSPFLRHKKL
jgi:hypothetical protein